MGNKFPPATIPSCLSLLYFFFSGKVLFNVKHRGIYVITVPHGVPIVKRQEVVLRAPGWDANPSQGNPHGKF